MTSHLAPRPARRPVKPLLGRTREELVTLLAELGAPSYRADQLMHGLYRDRITSVGDLTTFPRSLREALDATVPVGRLDTAASQRSPEGTVKLLLALEGDLRVEAVAIPAGERLTACLSTQAGCALGCRFCATARMGLMRNLYAGEVVAQFLALEEATKRRVTNVVFMGMGEPLANFAETVRAIRLLNDAKGIGLRKRGIRVSTVGLAPQIERLGRIEPQVGLTVSLSAPRDSLRERIMPVNRKYPLERLMLAVDRFFQMTGRMVTFAYVIIPGVNDSPREAQELAVLLRGRPCKLNLIPHNPHEILPDLSRCAEPGGGVWEKGSPAGLAGEGGGGARRGRGRGPNDGAARDAYGRHPMVDYLQERLPHVTFRRSRGLPIDAACGQLYYRTVSD